MGGGNIVACVEIHGSHFVGHCYCVGALGPPLFTLGLVVTIPWPC